MNDSIMETTVNTGFKNSLDHLLAEMKRIEFILISSAKRTGLDYGQTYFNVDSTEPILQGTLEYSAENPSIDVINQSINNIKSEIDRKKQESLQAGKKLALCELQRLFNLSSLDIEVILMCLLPELEPRFERYYAYLQDDITRKMPTINIFTKLLGTHLEETLEIKRVFDPDAPLIKNNLIRILSSPGQISSSLTSRFVQIEERIVDYLTDYNNIDLRLWDFVHLRQPAFKLQDVALPWHFMERLSGFIRSNKEKSAVFYFQGLSGTGKRTTAEAICHETGINLLYVDIKRMLTADIPTDRPLSLILREGLLQSTAIYLDRCDLLSENEYSTCCETLLSGIDDYPYPFFISSENNLEHMQYVGNKLLVKIAFDIPDYATRKKLWQRLLKNITAIADDVNTEDLAGKFRLTPGQIKSALSSAFNLAVWHDSEKGLITSNDLYLACRQQSRQGLNRLTSQVTTLYNWDDIILPHDQKEQLQEICNQVKYQHIVYNDWGFGQKIIRGKGLNALFSGPSGTGKTMAAEIMGNELGIDVYKIDLSTIVSKYIGETEKNIDRIFREGTTANAIIFFDEADSLFGKRSEVRDSHDRYANIEISYLLQKMEEYSGVIILATNLRKNIDDAFARRMHFVVEFPMPEEPDRYRIWSGMFPERAPLGQSIDLDFLARQFAISGGNIKNIVVASAFLAAQDGGFITMENIIRATKREYQKMGKLCTEKDFSKYFDLIKG